MVGLGGFGRVFKGVRKFDQRKVAIKVSKEDFTQIFDEKEKEQMLEEVKTMKLHPHPFIVKIIDDYIDDRDHQCIV